MGAGAVGLQEESWGELSFASVAERQLAEVQCAAIKVRRLELEMGMDDKRKQREQLRLDDIREDSQVTQLRSLLPLWLFCAMNSAQCRLRHLT